MVFNKESDFEEALIEALTHKGWESKILKNPTEDALLKNWADILFENNRGIDRLNDYPLTSGEMQQIMEQIYTLRSPLKLNGFINGKTVAVTRDNPDDVEHFGKEVSLKIYDRHEIAAGQSRYQIAQQPIYKSKTKILSIKNKKSYKLSCIFLCICILFFSTRKKFVLVNLLLFRSFSHNPSFFSDLKFHSYFQVNIGFLVNQKILKFKGLYYV